MKFRVIELRFEMIVAEFKYRFLAEDFIEMQKKKSPDTHYVIEEIKWMNLK